MNANYNKLWHILLDRNMKKKELAELAGVSTYTINKLNKNKNIGILVLCRYGVTNADFDSDFVEGRDERKTIKSLLDFHTLDMIEELDHLIETLEEKRKRIDGIIKTIRISKITAKLSESTLREMGDLDVTCIYKDKSFSSSLENFIVHFAEYSVADNEEAELYMSFWYNLIAVGRFLGTLEDAKQVQIIVYQAYKRMMEINSKKITDSMTSQKGDE